MYASSLVKTAETQTRADQEYHRTTKFTLIEFYEKIKFSYTCVTEWMSLNIFIQNSLN
ncbi:hypothetical protein PABG_11753 [Paracoccidioides brasiliensis Pb03]|nr:hypothetical protein PABG_11753 [Paracoccidioides brasiliensis Pb03]